MAELDAVVFQYVTNKNALKDGLMPIFFVRSYTFSWQFPEAGDS